MSMKLPLVNDGISYKKGKRGQFLRDRKGFKKYDITEGGTELTNPYLHLKSLNRNGVNEPDIFCYLTHLLHTF